MSKNTEQRDYEYGKGLGKVAYDAGYEGLGDADCPAEFDQGNNWEIWNKRWKEGQADRAEDARSCWDCFYD